MDTFIILYFLVGAVVVLPSTDELHFAQLLAVICTWPVVVIYTLVNIIKGDL